MLGPGEILFGLGICLGCCVCLLVDKIRGKK